MPTELLLSGKPTPASYSVNRGWFCFSCSSLFFFISFHRRAVTENVWMAEPLSRYDVAMAFAGRHPNPSHHTLLRDGKVGCGYFACKYSNFSNNDQAVCRVSVRMSHDGILTTNPRFLRARYSAIALLAFIRHISR